MSARTVCLVAANILDKLDDRAAARALDQVLAEAPDVAGLVEWTGRRDKLARREGKLIRLPRARAWVRLRQPARGFVFTRPLAGGPTAVLAAEFGELLSVRRVRLARRRKGVRPTYGTELVIREHGTGKLWAFLVVHLIAHHDRPANLAAWVEGREGAEAWAESWHGFAAAVLGDVNKHDLQLPPLVSCWKGNRLLRTFAHRTIDGVWTNRRAHQVTTLDVGSDHAAVVALYDRDAWGNR